MKVSGWPWPCRRPWEPLLWEALPFLVTTILTVSLVTLFIIAFHFFLATHYLKQFKTEEIFKDLFIRTNFTEKEGETESSLPSTSSLPTWQRWL